MSTLTVECVACYWEQQRTHDPLATIRQNADRSWAVHYGDGTTGPATYGTLSSDPRLCLCEIRTRKARP